jgi:hypothetical protein
MGTTTASVFWEKIAPVAQGATYALAHNRSSLERRISYHLGRGLMRQIRRVGYTLLGAAVGGTATDTYTRRTAPTGLTDSKGLGGLITMETVTTVNRATTAADLTAWQNIFNRNFTLNPTISGYPTVLGSGGGGQVGK